MGAFNLFPAEVISIILLNIDDLDSLGSFIQASAVAYRAFDYYAVDLVKNALSSRELCGHIRTVFLIIAHIRSGTLPISNASEFRYQVVKEAFQNISRTSPSRYGFAPETLPQDTSPAVLRSLLVTAEWITASTLDTLDYYLLKFRALDPQEPVEQELEYDPRSGEPSPFKNWSTRAWGKSVKVRDAGPPSWVEEQRVARAWWRLQLIYELKRAAANGQLRWPEDKLRDLSGWVAVYVQPGTQINSGMADRMLGAPEVLPPGTRIPNEFYSQTAHAHQDVWRGGVRLHRLIGPPEHEHMMTVIGYAQDVYGHKVAHAIASGNDCLPQVVARAGIPLTRRVRPMAQQGAADWRDLHVSSPALRDYGRASEFYGTENTLLEYFGFRSFRGFGFGIWSKRRLKGYGFHPKRSGAIYRKTYTWQSVLDPVQIEQAEAFAKFRTT